MPTAQVLELESSAAAALRLTLHHSTDPRHPTYLIEPAMGLRASFYEPLLVALAGAGINAAVLELRGHQQLPAPPPSRRHDYGYRDLADDLAAAVRMLRRSLPGSPIIALGHSLGGQVALAQAALHPPGDEAAPDSIVLVASAAMDWRSWPIRPARHLLRTQAAAATAVALGHFPGPQIGFAGREARTQMVEWARWARTGRFIIGRPAIDVGERAGAITQPVLVLSFERDPLAPRAAADALARLMPSARVSREHLVLTVRRSHFVWVRDPGAARERLIRWADGERHP